MVDRGALLAGAAALEAVAAALLDTAERDERLGRAVDAADEARRALDHAAQLRRAALRKAS